MVVMVLTLHSICVLWLEISIFFQATLREENVLPHNVFQICTVESFFQECHPPYSNSPGYCTAYHSVGSHTLARRRLSILLYSALHLSFIKLLFYLDVLLSDHLHCWRTACRLLTYCTRALESSIHWSLCTNEQEEENDSTKLFCCTVLAVWIGQL